MKGNKKILWISQTAVFLALLIVMQIITAPLGISLVTGTIVNLILIVSVMTCGILSGLTIASISPFFAKLLGIGPLWSLVPFIALGNIVLVLIWHFLGNRNRDNKYISYVIALITAAICKFLTLYITIVCIAIPVFLNLPEKQAAVISNTFSIPQLITASIGGALAIIIIPIVKKSTER